MSTKAPFRSVDDRQRVAVPPAIRRHLGLNPGDWAEYEPQGDYVILRKANAHKPASTYASTLDERGRMIMPAAVSDYLGLHSPYSVVEFEPHEGHVRLHRIFVRRAKGPSR